LESTTVVDTLTTLTDRLGRSLSDIRQTPLDHIPTDDVAVVVRHVVNRDTETPATDVAAFNSSI
jgi:hypothetical protein